MGSATAFNRQMGRVGPSLALAGLAISFAAVVSPGTASADECSDGQVMDQTGVCAPGSVNEASSASDAVSPGAAALNACEMAQAEADANSIGAQTADIPCPGAG